MVLDLYAESCRVGELGPGDYVVSCRREDLHPGPLPLPPDPATGRARAMRVEHEYERGGALAYLAAWDVHQARLFGRCEPTTGIAPFGRLVEQVMTTEPYASARRVFWIVDNGSSHRGRASVDRLEGAWPNLQPGPPAHPRLLAEPGRDLLLDRATQGLDPQRLHRPGRGRAPAVGFQRRYQQTAVPFDWRFTRADLAKLLRRLDEHDHRATAA